MTRTADGSPPIVCTPRRIASASPITTGTHSLRRSAWPQQCLRGNLRSNAGDIAERQREHRFGLHAFILSTHRTSASSAPKPPAFVNTGSSVRLSADDDAERNALEQAVDDANARRAELRERFSRAVTANQPTRCPTRSRSTCAANSAARLSATAAIAAALCGGRRTTTSGNAPLKPRHLCVRHGIQRADLQENTRIFRLGMTSSAAVGPRSRGGCSRPDRRERPANPPEPTANRLTGLRRKSTPRSPSDPRLSTASTIADVRRAGRAAAMSLVVTGVTGSRPNRGALHRLSVNEQPIRLRTVRPIRGIRRTHNGAAHRRIACATP